MNSATTSGGSAGRDRAKAKAKGETNREDRVDREDRADRAVVIMGEANR